MTVQLLIDSEHEACLPRSATAPGAARRAVERWFGPLLETSELERVKLLTSELVTNAVLHGSGDITLLGRRDSHHVLVEVIDEGEGFDPELRYPGAEETSGRGLAIVDAESGRWGINDRISHVWFELERGGAAGASEVPRGLATNR